MSTLAKPGAHILSPPVPVVNRKSVKHPVLNFWLLNCPPSVAPSCPPAAAVPEATRPVMTAGHAESQAIA